MSEGSRAVVLRTVPVGESDLVVILLTQDQGKVSARARGARKSKRRFPGGLPVGARGTVTLRAGQRPPHALGLEGFATEAAHHDLGRDLERYAFVHYCCELADVLVSGTQGDDAVFEALCVALNELCDEGGASLPSMSHPGSVGSAGSAGPARAREAGPGADWGAPLPRSARRALALRRYELKLLAALGQSPALYACCICGGSLPQGPDVAVSPERGGALCQEHARGSRRISGETLLLAERLMADEPIQAPPSERLRKDLRWLSFGLISPQIGRPLRSLAFFRQLASIPGPRG